MLKIKSIIAMLMATAMTAFAAPMIMVNAAEQEVHGTGLLLGAEEEMEVLSESDSTDSRITLPSQVDLSTDGYFPPIGDQGSMNSCASWATTYYQFTHDAHKLNGISTTSQNAYSPRWTYNFVNGGSNYMPSLGETYNVIKRQGAVTMGEYPYFIGGVYYYNWLNNENAMLNALKTKVSNKQFKYIDVTSDPTPITSATDADLTEVKELLYNGHVLVVGMRCSGTEMTNCSFKNASNGEKAIYRSSWGNNAGGHAVAIVGYDDTIKCDFNNDGTFQSSEKGAFKVANSFGTTFGNNGYIWVMYDALNKVSANIPNTWESGLPGQRNPIFDQMCAGSNNFNYIDVQNPTVNLAAVIHFSTANCNKLDFATKRDSSSYYTVLHQAVGNTPRSFNGSFVLDFGTLDDNIENYLSGHNWWVQISNTSGYPMSNISYKIVDDRGNTIKTYSPASVSLASGVTANYSITLNMQRGDVDYSGTITSADQDMVLDYVVEMSELSSMQKILADYNQDGTINIMDVIAIGHVLTSNGQEITSNVELIERLYRQYAIENGLDANADVNALMGGSSAAEVR